MSVIFDSLQYYTPLLHNLLIVLGVEYFGNGYLLGFFLQVLARPLDQILPLDDKNMDKDEVQKKKTHISFTIPLFATIIADTLQMFYILNKITDPNCTLSHLNIILLIITAGITMGNTVNVSHELIHRLTFVEQAAGVLNFMRLIYSHYQIFHIQWHHKKVGTEEDPIVAKKNQTLFQYLPRQVFANYLISWRCENDRLRTFNNVKYPQFSYMNRMIIYTLVQVIYIIFLYKLYSLKGLLVYFSMLFVAVTVAEAVEYFEHYGLYVAEGGVISYETSWNSNLKYTNISSFKLERHSDHHVNAYKEYQIASFDYSWPMLPESYLFMIQVSMNPQLFFDIMNPRLEAYLSKKTLKEEQQKKEMQLLNQFAFKQTIIHSSLLAISLVF